jgi:hypothetical protein
MIISDSGKRRAIYAETFCRFLERKVTQAIRHHTQFHFSPAMLTANLTRGRSGPPGENEVMIA